MFPAFLVLLFASTNPPELPQFVVPNFRDTTIKLRKTHAIDMPRTSTLWLHGARERMENGPDQAQYPPALVTIFQCDQKTTLQLRVRTKTYTKSTSRFRDVAPGVLRLNPLRDAGPEVAVTIDSVDTGEVREMGSYQAHRIKTKITVKPPKGASIVRSKTLIDGWYIDLPGLSCHDAPPPQLELAPYPLGWPRANRVFKYTGDAKRGFAVQEIFKKKQAGNVIIDKTELVEFSEQPVDPSLFEPPSDFTEVQFGSSHLPGPIVE
jgi:hypothetical protein